MWYLYTSKRHRQYIMTIHPNRKKLITKRSKTEKPMILLRSIVLSNVDWSLSFKCNWSSLRCHCKCDMSLCDEWTDLVKLADMNVIKKINDQVRRIYDPNIINICKTAFVSWSKILTANKDEGKSETKLIK